MEVPNHPTNAWICEVALRQSRELFLQMTLYCQTKSFVHFVVDFVDYVVDFDFDFDFVHVVVDFVSAGITILERLLRLRRIPWQ